MTTPIALRPFFDNPKSLDWRSPPDSSIVGYWTMDEVAGSLVYDHSIYHNNGVTVNGPTRILRDVGRCMEFASAGTNQVSLGNPSTLANSAVTLSAWVRADAFTNAYEGIISRAETTQVCTLLVKSNGKLAVYMSAATVKSYDGTGTYTLQANAWSFLAATYDSVNGLAGYVNGQLDGTATANGALGGVGGTDSWSIGAHPSIGGREWNGSIRDARIHSRALPAGEVADLYRSYVTPRGSDCFDIYMYPSTTVAYIGSSFLGVGP